VTSISTGCDTNHLDKIDSFLFFRYKKFRMKKILFPTDFSPNADHALKYAAAFCSHLNAELILFHSCRVKALATSLQDDVNDDGIFFASVEKLNEYRISHHDEIKQVFVEEKVSIGLAVDAIIDTATKMNVDIICMGTKGASGIKEILLGSNTTAVMEGALCPVRQFRSKRHSVPLKKLHSQLTSGKRIQRQ
jgi:nucleotide-binding universal stress UspA family protein